MSEMSFLQVERLGDKKIVQLNVNQILSLEKASKLTGVATIVTDIRGVRYLAHTSVDSLKERLKSILSSFR